MNEQQRMGLTIALCLAIFIGYSALFPPRPPVRSAAKQADISASADGSGLPDPTGQQVAAGQALSAAQAPPPPTMATLPFATPVLQGSLTTSRAGLSALTLRGFHRQPQADEEQDVAAEELSLGGPDSEAGLQAQLLLASGEEVAWRPLSGSSKETDLGLEASVGGREVRLVGVPRPDGYAIDYVLEEGPAPPGAAALDWRLRLSLLAPPEPQRGFPLLPAPTGTQLTALCEVGGALKRTDMPGIVKKQPSFSGRVGWAGIDKQYFLVAAAPKEGDFTGCQLRSAGQMMMLDLALPKLAAAQGGAARWGYALYAGPKRDSALAQVAPSLTGSLDYTVLGVPLGFLARPMVFLLNHFHALTHSWGAAIALLTLVVKALLFPVTYKSIVSMRRMQAIKPQLDELRKAWAHDPARQNEEQLAMLRKHNANPLGGCLPALLQMPVWLALYNMLRSAVDLYQQPFLWLSDLTLPEPIPLLAVTVGVLTLVQQKMTPVAADGAQAKIIMYALPVLFTVFMFALPSGLVVYILVNSILTIVQQLAINRFSDAKS